MKKVKFILMAMVLIFLILGTSNVYAYQIIASFGGTFTIGSGANEQDIDLTNPQWVTPSDTDLEIDWLEALLASDPDNPVYLDGYNYYKDDTNDPNDNYTGNWVYAIFKYGVGKPGVDNPDHWAIWNNTGVTGYNYAEIYAELGAANGQLNGLPSSGLSHTTFVTPIPTAVLLLGSGLIGLAGLRRKKKLL
jgi:hypothetical protein